MIHLGPNIHRRETEEDRTARRRAAATATTFGNRNQSGPRIDFNAKGAPAASSGMGVSFADAYGSTAFKADIVRRDERDAVVDRLPAVVAKLVQTHGVTDIQLLQVVGAVHRKSTVMGHQAVQVFPDEIGREIGATRERAEALMEEAVRRGFVASLPRSYWVSKL